MTTETIMINQQINMAIAEACGWESETTGPSWCEYETKMPDYCNDLNAMHEAEKMLTHEQQVQFSVELWKLTTSHVPSSRAAWIDFTIAHATAAQRAEAFLRTIGKWEEEA